MLINITDFEFRDPVTLQEKVDLGKLQLGLEGGTIELAEEDIGPSIANALKVHFAEVLRSETIPWGGKLLSFPGLLQQIAEFNTAYGQTLC
mmetsp:Transcript_12976/g.30322  ORF Transcript_12976/g.30322 Transcript_12976/m.30322 type:complete len:91 (+) Transcript_12976:163-435(+)